MHALVADRVHTRHMPPPGATLVPGVRWGRFDVLFTPAYWCGQAWQASLLGFYRSHALGRTLTEETAACMLGGYGIPAEVGLAAFERLRARGRLATPPCPHDLEQLLAEPLPIGERTVRYRFHRAKARYLAAALPQVQDIERRRLHGRVLREALRTLPGIGPKTASWIVRNYQGAADVAILDVHVLRAGSYIGLFPNEDVPTVPAYMDREARFLRFAEAIEACPASLDAIIWDHMRTAWPRTSGRAPRTSNHRQPDPDPSVVAA